MRSFALVTALAAVGVSAGPTTTEKELPRRAEALPSVTASGNAFFAGDSRFYMRGIDYQPGGSSKNVDPLADTSICGRDIPKFKELGVNTVRVYSVDNSADHAECMQQLNDAGIYLVLDVNSPSYSIRRDKPAPSYNADYLQSVFATIDEFQQYSNTLAFFSGNEVINNDEGSTQTAPFVKATTRDMRQYIVQQGYRKIPVGYSAADVSDNRMQTAQYFNCGSEFERSDFFAFNDYSWCSPSSYKTSGWDQKVKNFTGYGIPIFLSEWGCITNGRDFSEMEALMSDDMTPVYSGGLMYEYSLEDNDFGIVKIDGDSIDEQPEFAKMASAFSKYAAPTGDGGFTSTTNSVACPTTDDTWDLGDWGSSALPALPTDAERFMTEGAGDGPGLNGPGSQDSGTEEHETAGASAGSPTATAASSATDSEGASVRGVPPVDNAIFAISGVVTLFTLVGTMLL
ncbi:putative glycoside hydrolase family 72 protein [Eutypa lata UCREL1]|uniref:1,3-beta-glucanosyltransferase n=1 Tax=Eutypa lata (strain UCR-EL1) TaxID=1287681 RepID=M7SYW1_EUTLA|nr:putative glycoside hydrolase family 72 protein [Eutypa lata UCREL1]